ncbi:MAG: LpxI family protein [Fusobacteriota bacterium]
MKTKDNIGIIVGKGKLPYYFYKVASKKHNVFPLGLFDEVCSEIKKIDNYRQFNLGHLEEIKNYLLQNKIEKLIMLGKVEKSIIFNDLDLDTTFQEVVAMLPDRKDETIVLGIIEYLKRNGIDILPQNYMIDNLLVKEKLYTESAPDIVDENTIKIGIEAASMLGKLDVGQTVVVNNQSVVTLEGVEGTDKTIQRAGKYAPRDSIVVKVARPDQDMRIDVPAIGEDTIDEVININGKGIVIEANRVIFLDKEKVIKKANDHGIFIKGIVV